MLKLILYIIVLFFVSDQLRAQDPVFSQFMFNQVNFNPAFAGTGQSPRFTAGYRNQWPGLGNTYISYYASYDQFAEKLSGGIGIALNKDEQGDGVFSTTGLDVIYSYPFAINPDLMVNMGLQAGINQNSLNTNGLILADQNPFTVTGQNEIIPDQSIFYPDFSAGISFYSHEQYQLSIAVHHLNTPKIISGSAEAYTLPMLFTLQMLSQFPGKPEFNEKYNLIFYPGIMVQMQKEYLYLNYGSNLQYKQFLTGFWLRNDLLFHINTFILMAGWAWSGIHITYSYDLWLPKTSQPTSIYNSNEVTLIYLFQYKETKKKRKALNCPKF
jgi:type IX secretion system PorP/SprF family membrane protein